MRLRTLLCFLMLVLTLVSCRKDDKPQEIVRHRTLLMYIVSENSLIGYDNKNIAQILMACKNLKDGEEIVIYIDNNQFPAIYTIDNKTKATELSELIPEYEYATDHNSCSGTVLSEFIGYAKAKHPAEAYGLVMWSHGSGWIPSYSSMDGESFSKRRSFGLDNEKNTNFNNGRSMSVSEMHNAMKSLGQKFDYILFDCCFMQCVEIDYELRDVAKYIIASPAEIPGPGAPYHLLINAFFDESNYPLLLSKLYYDLYYQYNSQYGVLISTCDCSMMEQLALETRNIVSKYKDKLMQSSYDDVVDYFLYGPCRHKQALPDFYDINSIMKNCASADDYEVWKKAFDKAYPYSFATDRWYSIYTGSNLQLDKDQYGGASMYIPLEKYSMGMYARDNAFFVNAYSGSEWAQMIWQ